MTKFFIGFLILANVTCCLSGMEEIELKEVSAITQTWRPIIELATEKSNQYHTTIEQFFTQQLPSDNIVRAHTFTKLQITINKQVGYGQKNNHIKKTLLSHLALAYNRKQEVFYAQRVEHCKDQIQKALENLGNGI